jgi:hypothetical protein
MSLVDPRVRAVQTQLLLRSIERLPTAERDAVFAGAGRAALDAVDAVLPVGWHPMALHMCLSDALRAVGPERNVRVWEATMAACFERPILRGFVDMSTSLFGVTPLSVLRQVERIYGQITRDLGVVRFDPSPRPREGDIALSGFPADRFHFECYVEGLQGCIEAVLPLAHARGEVKVIDCAPARGDVRYRISWVA